VPKPRRVRADSVNPDATEVAAVREMADDTQTIEFHEGSSGEEN